MQLLIRVHWLCYDPMRYGWRWPDVDRSPALPKSKRTLSFASVLHRTSAGQQQTKDDACRSTNERYGGYRGFQGVQHHVRLLLHLQSHTDGNGNDELCDLADCQTGQADERGIRLVQPATPYAARLFGRIGRVGGKQRPAQPIC